jgi:hypothetical protein
MNDPAFIAEASSVVPLGRSSWRVAHPLDLKFGGRGLIFDPSPGLGMRRAQTRCGLTSGHSVRADNGGPKSLAGVWLDPGEEFADRQHAAMNPPEKKVGDIDLFRSCELGHARMARP